MESRICLELRLLLTFLWGRLAKIHAMSAGIDDFMLIVSCILITILLSISVESNSFSLKLVMITALSFQLIHLYHRRLNWQLLKLRGRTENKTIFSLFLALNIV